MELPDYHSDLEDGAGARLGQYGRLQTRVTDPAHGRAHRRDLRRMRAPARCAESGLWRRTRSRRHDRAASGHPRRVIHRIERRGCRSWRCRARNHASARWAARIRSSRRRRRSDPAPRAPSREHSARPDSATPPRAARSSSNTSPTNSSSGSPRGPRRSLSATD